MIFHDFHQFYTLFSKKGVCFSVFHRKSFSRMRENPLIFHDFSDRQFYPTFSSFFEVFFITSREQPKVHVTALMFVILRWSMIMFVLLLACLSLKLFLTATCNWLLGGLLWVSCGIRPLHVASCGFYVGFMWAYVHFKWA